VNGPKNVAKRIYNTLPTGSSAKILSYLKNILGYNLRNFLCIEKIE
jgi:hypothetical protein